MNDPMMLAATIAGAIVVANFVSYLGKCMISLLDLALEDLFGRPGLITPVIGALSILGTMAGVMYAYHLWRVTR